jgi:hypothetical protein
MGDLYSGTPPQGPLISVVTVVFNAGDLLAAIHGRLSFWKRTAGR